MGYEVIPAGATSWLCDAVADARVSVGEHTFYEGPITLGIWTPTDRIRIGRFSWIARDTLIFGGGNHATRSASSFDFSKLFGDEGLVSEELTRARETVIGHDVWLGHGVTVLPGAQIGDGAVVGAEAVVAGRVAPYTIVAGNPARPIRTRFQPETIERLLRLRWWDWPLPRIQAALPWLHSDPDHWPDDLEARLASPPSDPS